MQFPTFEFAYFLLVVVTLSWALRSRRTAHKLFLLAASYFFASRLHWGFAAMLFVSSLANWLFGEAISRSAGPRSKRAWLGGALVANLGVLGAFKYYGFFRENVAELAGLLGLEAHLPVLELLLPVGLSFYTFQGLAYLFDLYRGKGRRAASALDFLLFMAFFPKLVSGPICRGHELLPQLEQGPPDRVPELSRAVALIASGLFKKVFLATLIGARLVDGAFLTPENYSSLELLVAAYGYSIQLYCDFSGYTDMARGVALLLGYRLPENFDAPYVATDPGQFWRRWHMTFSSWLRDYIYFPLGGSRGSLSRTCLNLLVTFVLCGLWHGASWGYVIWGGVHGVTLCLHKLLRDSRRALGLSGSDPWWWSALGWLVTFHVCVLSRISFRAADLETTFAFFARLLSFEAGVKALGWPVLLACAVGFGLNFLGRPLREGFIQLHERIPWALRPVVWAGLGVALLSVKPAEVAPYIYFQF